MLNFMFGFIVGGFIVVVIAFSIETQEETKKTYGNGYSIPPANSPPPKAPPRQR